MPGLPELLVILVIVVIIFGAGRLPQLGEAFGRGIRNFKKASRLDDSIDVTPKQISGRKSEESSDAKRAGESKGSKSVVENVENAIEVMETEEEPK